jgi:hypothetical protein
MSPPLLRARTLTVRSDCSGVPRACRWLRTRPVGVCASSRTAMPGGCRPPRADGGVQLGCAAAEFAGADLAGRDVGDTPWQWRQSSSCLPWLMHRGCGRAAGARPRTLTREAGYDYNCAAATRTYAAAA